MFERKSLMKKQLFFAVVVILACGGLARMIGLPWENGLLTGAGFVLILTLWPVMPKK